MAHLGAIAFISRAVPDRYSAAAQGAAGAMAVGGVMALQMVLSAWLYPMLGGTHLRPRHRLRRPRPRALPLARPPLAGRETGRLARLPAR